MPSHPQATLLSWAANPKRLSNDAMTNNHSPAPALRPTRWALRDSVWNPSFPGPKEREVKAVSEVGASGPQALRCLTLMITCSQLRFTAGRRMHRGLRAAAGVPRQDPGRSWKSLRG